MSLGKKLMLGVLELAFVVALLFAGFGFQVDRTLLNGEFIAGELEETDAVNLALNAWLANLPADVVPYEPALSATARDLQAWISAHTRKVVQAGSAYLRGESTGFRLDIDLQPVHRSLENNLRAHLLKSPPPEITQLPVADQPRARRELEKTILTQLALPIRYEIDLDNFSPEQRSDFSQLRELVGYFFRVYYGAMATAILAGLLLWWIGSMAWLGSGLVVFGAIAASVATFSSIPVLSWIRALLPELPTSLELALPDVYAALARPLLGVGLVCIAAGGVFCALAWILSRRARPVLLSVPPEL